MTRVVYLDNTIPSYLFDERASLQTYIEVTQRWWEEERQHFDLWVSEETIAEVSRGEYPNKTKIIECVSHIAVLAPHPYIIEIAQVYLNNSPAYTNFLLNDDMPLNRNRQFLIEKMLKKPPSSLK